MVSRSATSLTSRLVLGAGDCLLEIGAHPICQHGGFADIENLSSHSERDNSRLFWQMVQFGLKGLARSSHEGQLPPPAREHCNHVASNSNGRSK